MGVGYAELFLIVFLTHPGVIVPSTTSLKSMIPAGGMPIELPETPIAIAALWQLLWVWILSRPAERNSATGWTMYTIYLIFLGIYAYFFASSRVAGGW
jgi:hypothetical protein